MRSQEDNADVFALFVNSVLNSKGSHQQWTCTCNFRSAMLAEIGLQAFVINTRNKELTTQILAGLSRIK